MTQTFPPASDSPSAARHFVTDTLWNWRIQQLADPAALIVTELASNAVVHAESDFTVTLSRGRCLRISVRDGSTFPPTKTRGAPIDAPSGRGIGIVSALASAWGTEPADGGKVVWAELDL